MTKKNDNSVFDQGTMRQGLERIAIVGAMHSDEEWETFRDDFIDAIVKGLNLSRAEVRYKVVQGMSRTDENE